MTSREGKTPVTILQEHFSKLQETPTYNLIHNGTGSHVPTFTYEVTGLHQTATGSGKSKKEAKHEAAKAFLEKLSISYSFGEAPLVNGPVVDQVDASIVTSPYAGNLKDNAVGELNDFCTINNLKMPEYDLTRDEGLAHAKIFAIKCTVSSYTTEATERTKKQAKQRAAQDMLQILKKCIDHLEQNVKREDNKMTTDNALELCIEKNIFTKTKLSGLNLKDYHKALKGDNFQSAKLNSIKGFGPEWVDKMPNVTEVFEEIMKDITVEYSLVELNLNTRKKRDRPVFMKVLMVKSSPEWTYFGKGETPEQASEEAIRECLKFFIELSETAENDS